MIESRISLTKLLQQNKSIDKEFFYVTKKHEMHFIVLSVASVVLTKVEVFFFVTEILVKKENLPKIKKKKNQLT